VLFAEPLSNCGVLAMRLSPASREEPDELESEEKKKAVLKKHFVYH
jgi:hypothetical protein